MTGNTAQMDRHPSVTWLMPVRNGMPYLPLTLRSIAEQTYPNHSIIVWDNGSTDGTLEVLQQWIPSKIPGLIVQDRPLRLGPAMAALIEMAPTELCAVIHGDDINFPTRLQRQVEFMRTHPNAGAVGGQIEIIDDNGLPVPTTGDGWIYETNDASVRWRTRWQAQFCHPAAMLRRSAVLAVGNYHDLQPYEDFDLWVRMAAVTELWNLDEKVLQYRRSSTSSTGGIVDYLSLEREAAEKNLLLLFPNISNKERAMDLWDATHPSHLDNPSTFQQIFQLKKAAVELAKAVGKPLDYFTQTRVFRNQHYMLKKRLLDRLGLAPLVRLRHRLASGDN